MRYRIQKDGRGRAALPKILLRLPPNHIVPESSPGNIGRPSLSVVQVRARARAKPSKPYHPGRAFLIGLAKSGWRCERGGTQMRGRRAAARHPLYRLHPGGGDGYREVELVFGGDGPCDPSPGYARQRGRQMPADRPISQALPSGRATNFVSAPDFTRNNTVCFPSLRASERPLLTSAGVETGLPPTSRITSPTCRP